MTVALEDFIVLPEVLASLDIWLSKSKGMKEPCSWKWKVAYHHSSMDILFYQKCWVLLDSQLYSEVWKNQVRERSSKLYSWHGVCVSYLFSNIPNTFQNEM